MYKEITVLRNKVVKCKKEHTCWLCGSPIHVGEKAALLVGIWHGMGLNKPASFYTKIGCDHTDRQDNFAALPENFSKLVR